MKRHLQLTLLLALATSAAAQQHDHHPPRAADGRDAGGTGHTRSHYAGLHHREIKALSAEQIADLRAGRGMAMALPAELHGYPGPTHVLELAEPLALSAQQVQRTQQLADRMKTEAAALGEQFIAAEAALDRLFLERHASAGAVATAVATAARVQGQLRAAHLRYHLLMVDVLTPAQVAAYGRLRGY
ncbi:hypothetical protein [Caldimonas brevitalea]|uniref:Periplasmic heavy metal sensor n=1 Tax=Caldimonas brevitalea TaxID=413882 RepID=A0A0G3BTK0_9BURK|nr:hypothetical protein [Caldimonas brevitalea]AKJ30721.1 hypothetical protein AAW51_4030 [Caldimonas brevitalea]